MSVILKQSRDLKCRQRLEDAGLKKSRAKDAAATVVGEAAARAGPCGS